MTRVVAYPFLVARDSRVSATPWQSETGGERGELGHSLPHWDYNTDLRLARSVELLEHGIREDCALSPAAPVQLVVTWRCHGTNTRGCVARVPLDDSPEPRAIAVNVVVPASQLGERVDIATKIVLSASFRSGGALAPSICGSVLWTDVKPVMLEGTASRFPIEVCDFGSAHWAPYGAAWYLSWNRHDLHELFLRDVRLFVNSAHSAVVAAVQGGVVSPEHSAIRSAIYYDVARQLVRGALENEDFAADAVQFAEGSTGNAIARLIATLYAGESLVGLRNSLRERPEYFESRLQGSLRLFDALT